MVSAIASHYFCLSLLAAAKVHLHADVSAEVEIGSVECISIALPIPNPVVPVS